MKYKIKSKNIMPEAVEQIEEMVSVYTDNNIVIMPDYHRGKGCVIGTTMIIKDKVTPNHVGVDIGCGVSLYKLTLKNIDLKELDIKIKKLIPCGLRVRDTVYKHLNENSYSSVLEKELSFLEPSEIDRALKSLGTLGGGNHYIEVGKDEEENLYLSIHSGSRSLGTKVHKYYQDIAADQCKDDIYDELECIIENLKIQDRKSEISSTIKEFNKSKKTIPKDQKYIQYSSCQSVEDTFHEYIKAVDFVGQYARMNRQFMLRIIVEEILGEALDESMIIDKPHNSIESKGDFNKIIILRKGAQSSYQGEKVIIPINMRDGIILAEGLGNPDWNYSAPHGAGRVQSRTVAKNSTSMEEYKEMMKDVYSTTINKSTLDENPSAYKPMKEILDEIGETVNKDSIKIIKPIYNFKGGQ